MRKIGSQFITVLIILLIVIQFYQPPKNISKEMSNDDLMRVDSALPAGVKTALTNSCYNCHSDHTRYLWFDKIAPASWLVSHDIKNAREHLDFSKWGTYDALKEITLLTDIHDEIESKDMPLKLYLIMHPKAALSNSERDALMAWADDEAAAVLKQ
jgi:hypothetical protein